MLVRRTVRWLGALSACLLLAAGAAAWHFAGRAEGLVKSAVLAELRKVCPHAEIAVRRAAFDWTDTVTLTGLSVAAPAAGGGPARPFAEVAGVELTLDRARYREAGAVEVMAVTLVRPTVTLVRRHDGAWEAAGLLPLDLPDPAPAAPRWDVRDATVRLVLHTAPDDPAPLVAELAGVNLSLLPESRRAYRIEGTAAVSGGEADAGRVTLAGSLDLDRGRWGLKGTVRGLTLSGGLLADAFARDRGLQRTLAGARARWRGVEAKLAGERPPAAGPVRVAALGDALPVPAGPGPARLTDFGLDGDLAATFTLSAGTFAKVPAYDVTVTCRNGTLANRFLPFPLSNVSGEARLADGVCTLTRARGRHGETVAEAAGTFRPAVGGVAGRVTMSATRVPITREMRPRLPEALRKLHVMLDPTGVADVRTAVLESGSAVEDGVPKQRWELRGLGRDGRGRRRPARKVPLPRPGRAGHGENGRRRRAATGLPRDRRRPAGAVHGVGRRLRAAVRVRGGGGRRRPAAGPRGAGRLPAAGGRGLGKPAVLRRRGRPADALPRPRRKHADALDARRPGHRRAGPAGGVPVRTAGSSPAGWRTTPATGGGGSTTSAAGTGRPRWRAAAC